MIYVLSLFVTMLNDHFLVQCNFNPTRMLNATDGNILDLILTKTPDLVSDVEVMTDHFNSDHFPVSFNIKLLSTLPVLWLTTSYSCRAI